MWPSLLPQQALAKSKSKSLWSLPVRSGVLGDRLTPAGKLFAGNPSSRHQGRHEWPSWEVLEERAGTNKALIDLSQASFSSPSPGLLNLSQLALCLCPIHPLRGRREVSLVRRKKDQSWDVSERDPFLLSCRK